MKFLKKNKFKFYLTIIFILLINDSYANWQRMGTNGYNTIYYIDYNSIKYNEGFVYYLFLMDHIGENTVHPKSVVMQIKGDCDSFRAKPLSAIFYDHNMAGGNSSNFNYSDKEAWRYYKPGSAPYKMLESICSTIIKIFY